MRRRAVHRSAPWLALAATLGAGAPEQAPRLRFDPFAPPAAAASSEAAQGSERSEPAPGWSPVLTGTVVAGANSMANLAGVILRVGEQAHGYRLLEVKEGEAVFARGDTQVVLRVQGYAGATTP